MAALFFLSWIFIEDIYRGYLSWLVDETRLELN